ncbi:hypothetical protein D9619_005008 [Psilocybe cf. subviscida]|uniref:Uncharacterized protein n=1 Tax=Psilocybe cf. subviscida TaxID=2480587 RepID=A0A8H5F7Y4_9AGAR|nr:hypothetical protein D9619_005008 [Psilocybe cf. subviscida]
MKLFTCLVVVASTCATALSQDITAGTYRILGVQSNKYAYNFPLTIPEPGWNSITFEADGSHARNNSLWKIRPNPAEDSGWLIQNVVSSYYAYVPPEHYAGTVVTAYSVEPAAFAIEPAGAGTWVIKAPNEDLLWTVYPVRGNQFMPILEDASGIDQQKFKLIKA